jgi:hypothetical protein
VTPTEARDAVRGHAQANRISYTRHARMRMEQRGARRADVRSALITGTAGAAEPDDRWEVTGGVDLDGDDLTVVLVIADGLVVVTLF